MKLFLFFMEHFEINSRNLLLHYLVHASHTFFEGSCESEQSPRLMMFLQLFYDISGIQNRKDPRIVPALLQDIMYGG